MEAFSILIDKAASEGFLSGYKISNRSGDVVHITHLLFADDTLVFCKASILAWFEAISGLKINLEKSSVLPVRDVGNLEALASELGCYTGTLPTTYLGLPLGMRRNSTIVWDGVEERFRRKLALWKRQYISEGGRLTLIRSTLSNLPIYLMSLFLLPKGLQFRLEKIQRDFLCGDGNQGRKIHLLNWSTVCSSKENGGMRICNLSSLNRSLLGKWVWRFAVEDNSTWKDVINLKYHTDEEDWFTRAPRGCFGVGLWKDISKESKQLKQDVRFVVGDGTRISFWEDTWCGDRPLCEAFPSLFTLTFLSTLTSWAGNFVYEDCSFLRILLCIL